MSNNKDSELNDIIEGFQLFSSETGGKINPNEFKEIMDIMNINEKNPFLYNIVSNLCSNEDVIKNGIDAEDFISLLDQEINDISSTEGLEKIFSIFSNPNTNKIPMNSLSNILNEDKSANFEDENNKFQKLMSRPEINGKEIDFNEFHDMIKPEKPKQNIIYVKKSKDHKDFSYSNSSHKRDKNEENDININLNNTNSNNESNLISEKNYNNNIEIKDEIDNNNSNINYNAVDDNNIIKFDNNNSNNNEESENQNDLIEEKEYNDVNNFDNIDISHQQKEINNYKAKYRYINEKNQIEDETIKENKIEQKVNENFDKNISNRHNIFGNRFKKRKSEDDSLEKEDEKNDKTEKRYHRRYRDIKSPPQKKEEKSNNESKTEENNENKVVSNHWRYRRKK